jgi:hypothetical protein
MKALGTAASPCEPQTTLLRNMLAHLGRVCLTTDGSAVCSVQGSHKSNIQTPVSTDDYSRLITEVNTKKGDCVIFCEAW